MKKLMVVQPYHLGDEVIQPGTLYDDADDVPDTGVVVREVDTDDFPATPGFSQPEYSPGADPHSDGTVPDPDAEPPAKTLAKALATTPPGDGEGDAKAKAEDDAKAAAEDDAEAKGEDGGSSSLRGGKADVRAAGGKGGQAPAKGDLPRGRPAGGRA